MSSIMRRRRGLMASADLVEFMCGSALKVVLLCPLDPQASLPARHLTRRSNAAVYLAQPSASRAARSRGSGFVLWPKPLVRGSAACCLQWRGKRTVGGRGQHRRTDPFQEGALSDYDTLF